RRRRPRSSIAVCRESRRLRGAQQRSARHTSTRRARSTRRPRRRSEEHTSELQSLAYIVCRLLLEKKNLAVAIVRPFNTYGPCQSTRAVIPTILAHLIGDVDKLHLGATSPTRDFNYFEDTAARFID